MSGSGGGGGGGGGPLDALSGRPDAPMPEGQTVQDLLAAAQSQPWQGTPWAQMDPAYQQYVRTAYGTGPQQQAGFDRMQQRGGLDRMFGSSQPNMGEQLNPYQIEQRANWAGAGGMNGRDAGLGHPMVNQWSGGGPFANAAYQPMTYQEWQALRLPTGGSGGGTTPPPSDQLNGLIAQASDPWTTYGQMGVANPYLSAINNRFGWSPEGLAYGFDLRQQPTWYQPPYVMPKTVLPKISGGTTTSWT